MKAIPPEAEGVLGVDERHDAWVAEGLRALREQVPSDDSRRATLAQLGIGGPIRANRAGEPASDTANDDVASAPKRAAPTGSVVARWLLCGALLGALALIAQRCLGG
jgi:hypothetical protein